MLREAVTIAELCHGSDSTEAASAMTSLAVSLCALNRHQQALPLLLKGRKARVHV